MTSHKLLAYGPLPIRILAGITFIAHGSPKFENIAGTQEESVLSKNGYGIPNTEHDLTF